MSRKQTGSIFKNQQYTIVIDKLGDHGEGVGTPEGIPVYIPQTLPGEIVEARIIKLAAHFAVGKCMRRIQEAPERVVPLCPVADVCGGCQLQHLDYSAQLRYKMQKLQTLFEPLSIGDQLLPIIGYPEAPYHFRNKAQYAVGLKHGQNVQIGLYAPYSHRIVAITTCVAQLPVADAIVSAFRSFLDDTQLSIYDEVSHAGLVRYLLIRTTKAGQALVCVVCTEEILPYFDRLAQALKSVAGVVGLAMNVNTEKTDAVLGPVTKSLWGEPYIIEQIDGLEFALYPTAFFQSNPVQAETLLQHVCRWAGLSAQTIVWDAFSGAGFFSLAMARNAKRVFGVESDRLAVKGAEENARRNAITNTTFVCGDAGTVFGQWLDLGLRPDVVVMDPPRKGAGAAFLAVLIRIKPKRIIYVSCNPETVVKEAAVLCGHGYRILGVQPIDMFLHTLHTELIVIFEL